MAAPQLQVPAFQLASQVYYADTCEPLKQAVERGEVRLVARARGQYPGLPLPPNVLTEVRAVGFWDADHPQSWGLDWHRNEGIELTYVSRGKVRFAVDDEDFLLKQGDMTITRPWQAHRVGDPNIGACRLHWLILDVGVRRPNQTWCWPRWLSLAEADVQELTTLLSHNEHPVWPANSEIEHYFERLVEAAMQPNESRLRLYISGLFVAVTELLRLHEPSLDKSLSSAQRTVELFLARLPETLDQPWDLPLMADACGLGRTRFAHYCKQLTNMSPIEYLTFCRVEGAARRLWQQRKLSITDVALRCGFESSQYFARIFHQYKGCSPREFRRDSAGDVAPAVPQRLNAAATGPRALDAARRAITSPSVGRP
jgi:AraC family L-rhamnose operon regulatory protein RhaS